jgi:polyisoprenoid-binding protein YceI
MDQLIVIILAAAALIGSFINRSSGFHYQLSAIVTLCIIWLSKSGFAAADPYTLLLAVLTVLILAGHFAGLLLPKKWTPYLVLALTLAALVFSGKSFSYFGYEFEVTTKIALLPLLGGLVPVLAGIKAVLIKKWFAADEDSTSQPIAALLGAFLLFFATFQAQYLGVLLAGAGMFAVASAYRSRGLIAVAVAFVSFGFAFMVMKQHPDTDDSFMRGNFLLGLLLGAAAISWSLAALAFSRFKWIFAWLLPVVLVLAGIMMGVTNENFGGIPAFTGAVLGSVIVLAASRGSFAALPVHAAVLSLVLPVSAQFGEKKTVEIESRLTKTDKPQAAQETKPDVLDIQGVALSSQQEGLWKSVQDKSKLQFELGPEGGKTSGAFTKFDVQLDIDEKGEPVMVSLKMPASSITTFNDMRDESVRGEGFMETATHKTVAYKSKTIKKEGDRYFVTGDFTMLGVTKPVNLELKFGALGMEKDKQYLVMVGKAKLDRTQFGMSPDAKIGNEVSTTFEIELRK